MTGQPERRTVGVCRLSVCHGGHASVAEEPVRTATQIKCPNGHWTWEDGNFCTQCGVALPKSSGQPESPG